MADIKVLSSIATREAYVELVPQFERQTKHTVLTTWAGTVEIVKKMAAGEVHDLVMISSHELDQFIRDGRIVPGSRVDMAKSGIGAAVRTGAPKPDISSVDALTRTLLAAKTVGYTTGPSGIYMAELVERLGIGAGVKAKHRGVPSGGTIGTIVAGGGAEIGFQQVSEIAHIPGVDYIGPLPTEVQKITIFSAGLHTKAAQPEAAKALVAFLTSPKTHSVYRAHALETP